jgi:hypothetical protein
MFWIEPALYAPQWLFDAAKKLTGWTPDSDFQIEAIAMIRMYDMDPVKYPFSRDRTEEVRLMLKGLSGKRDIQQFDLKGVDLHRMNVGFEAVGAQFGQDFRIIVI